MIREAVPANRLRKARADTRNLNATVKLFADNVVAERYLVFLTQFVTSNT
jgi:hypothetical protein